MNNDQIIALLMVLANQQIAIVNLERRNQELETKVRELEDAITKPSPASNGRAVSADDSSVV